MKKFIELIGAILDFMSIIVITIFVVDYLKYLNLPWYQIICFTWIFVSIIVNISAFTRITINRKSKNE